jgi:hypothetical protein
MERKIKNHNILGRYKGMNRQSTGDFRAMKILCTKLFWQIMCQYTFIQTIECAIPRENSNVKYEL